MTNGCWSVGALPRAIAAAMLQQAGLAGTDYAQFAVLSGSGTSPPSRGAPGRRA